MRRHPLKAAVALTATVGVAIWDWQWGPHAWLCCNSFAGCHMVKDYWIANVTNHVLTDVAMFVKMLMWHTPQYLLSWQVAWQNMNLCWLGKNPKVCWCVRWCGMLTWRTYWHVMLAYPDDIIVTCGKFCFGGPVWIHLILPSADELGQPRSMRQFDLSPLGLTHRQTRSTYIPRFESAGSNSCRSKALTRTGCMCLGPDLD